MTEFRPTWEGGPPDWGPTVDAARWQAPREWGRAIRYRRARAIPCCVDEPTWRALLRLHEAVDALEASIVPQAQRLLDQAPVPGWPRDLTRTVMAALAEQLRAANLAPDMQEAQTRAAARCLSALADQAKAGALVLRRPHPRAVNVRLMAGRFYGRPVALVPSDDRDYAMFVRAAGYTVATFSGNNAVDNSVAEASYVECAIIRRQWWLRFIWTTIDEGDAP
jgi:hypothetical protein